MLLKLDKGKETNMSTISDSDMIVRRMTRSDIDTILTLDRKISQVRGKVTYRDLVVIEPSGPLDFSFVCEYQGVIVGFILARLAYLGIPLTGTCVIGAIAVDPVYQKHGIGSKMVNEVLDRCYREGVPKARALIDQEDTDLSRFFQGLAFKRSRIINYDNDAISDYLPSKSEPGNDE